MTEENVSLLVALWLSSTYVLPIHIARSELNTATLLVTIILTLIAVKCVDSLCDCRLFINNCHNMIMNILIYYTIVLLALLPSQG